MHLSPKISIIIPTYNSAKTLAVCLQSLVDQTFRDFEVLIIDGVSKDDTISIANSFASSIPKLSIHSEPDKGIYDAMNKGIGLAKGEWLYFLGSDDSLFDLNVLGVVAPSLQGDREVVYGNVKVKGNSPWSSEGQIYDGKFDEKKIHFSNICHQSMFFKKNAFMKYGLYSLKYPILADWAWNLSFFKQINFFYIDTIVAFFQCSGVSTATNLEDDFINDRHLLAYLKLHKSVFSSFYLFHFEELLPLICNLKKGGRAYYTVRTCFYLYRVFRKIK